jgi:hypothetical protein
MSETCHKQALELCRKKGEELAPQRINMALLALIEQR